jgi:hypothetical protein
VLAALESHAAQGKSLSPSSFYLTLQPMRVDTAERSIFRGANRTSRCSRPGCGVELHRMQRGRLRLLTTP